MEMGRRWGGECHPCPRPQVLDFVPIPIPVPNGCGNQIPSPLDFGLFSGPSPVHPRPTKITHSSYAKIILSIKNTSQAVCVYIVQTISQLKT